MNVLEQSVWLDHGAPVLFHFCAVLQFQSLCFSFSFSFVGVRRLKFFFFFFSIIKAVGNGPGHDSAPPRRVNEADNSWWTGLLLH